MEIVVACLLMIFACSGCAVGKSLPEVDFEWFNLSTNEIWVVDCAGLPPEATCGRLMPCSSEEPRHVKGSEFNETVHFKDKIVIQWKDNGKQGWPGGLKEVPLQPPTIPPGVGHEAEFKRADLGIPAKLSHAKVRFTYLGGDKWRIKIYGPTTTFGDTDQVKDFSPPFKP